MGVQNLSAAIIFDAGAPYPNNTVGKRLQEIAADVISASIPDGSIVAIKLDASDAAAFRVALGLVIGADVQAHHANLTELAGLTPTANRLIYYNNSGVLALATLSSFWRTTLDDGDAATSRASLGLVIGTNVQAYDEDLSAIAALTSAADKVLYATGIGTWALADFPAAGRALAASGESKDLVATERTVSGTTDAVAQSDHGKTISTTNGSSVTVTLPNNLTVGTRFTYCQDGDGQITFSPASGALLRNVDGHTKSAGKWASVSFRVRANSGGSAAEYVMYGRTAA